MISNQSTTFLLLILLLRRTKTVQGFPSDADSSSSDSWWDKVVLSSFEDDHNEPNTSFLTPTLESHQEEDILQRLIALERQTQEATSSRRRSRSKSTPSSNPSIPSTLRSSHRTKPSMSSRPSMLPNQEQRSNVTLTKPPPPRSTTTRITPVAGSSGSSSTRTTPHMVQEILRQHPSLMQIPIDYIMDPFNLAQLGSVLERAARKHPASQVDPWTSSSSTTSSSNTSSTTTSTTKHSYYHQALQLLTSIQNGDTHATPPTSTTSPHDACQRWVAHQLYCWIHQRYVTSPRGLDAVRRRLLEDPYAFGRCPRVACRGYPLLPHGCHSNDASPLAREKHPRSTRYCHQCGEIFIDWTTLSSDGLAWGSSFCHLFAMVHGPEVMVRAPPSLSSDGSEEHALEKKPVDPRIFGFRVHPSVVSQR